MRRLPRRLSAFLFITIVLVLTYTVFFPLFYKIKEPFFAMPVRPEIKITSISDLKVRHDDYGDGEFNAKRSGGRLHKGLDIVADAKTPVYASKSGWASFVYVPKGYGNLVVIDHPGGWQTRYGHLHGSMIKKSKWVGLGEMIGTVGKTGNANVKGMVPHIHFEIRLNDETLDPAKELLKKNREVR